MPLRRWLLAVGLAPLLGRADSSWYTRTWQTDDGLPNNHVVAVTPLADGELRVETRGGVVAFDGQSFTRLGTAPPREEDVTAAVQSLRAVTRSGEIWRVTGETIGRERAGQLVAARHHPNARIGPARDGGLWIAYENRLEKLAPDGEVRDCGHFRTDGTQPQATSVLEDRSGAVWIGTANHGLFRYSSDGFRAVETSYPYVLCLAEDADGNLWVGTDGGGLDRVAQRFVQLERYAGDRSSVGIQSLCEDAAGRIWGVTQNRWLLLRTAEGWTRSTDPKLQAIEGPLCVAAGRPGTLWIGTAHRALVRWQDHQLTSWGSRDGLESRSVHCLLPRAHGELWLGGYNPDRVQRMVGGKLQTLRLPGPVGAIRTLGEDAAGTVWVGTDRGLLRWREGDGDRLAPVPGADLMARSVLPTPDGTVWVGCAGGGLAAVRDGRVTLLGAASGLPDSYLCQLVDDGLGWLWIGSAEHGIYKVSFDQLNRAVRQPGARVRAIMYGRNEGLFNLEAYGAHSPDAIGPGALRSSDGRVWIPMRTALAVIEPRRVRENPAAPPVHLTGVSVDGQPAALPLRVGAGNRRIDFAFSVVNLSAPDNAHVRYRLDGIDSGWIDAGTQRVATYSRLVPGHYRFRLEACNFDGPWREAAATPAAVLPFFWQTWWFRVAVMGAFTAAVAGCARYAAVRRLRARHRQLEEQAALDRERARIARDLHDDLGGSLTQVAVMLDLTQQGAGGREGAKVGECVRLVRRAAQSVDEIIWAINPRNDTLPFLIDYLSQFAVEFLHAANIECSVELPDAPPDRAVAPEARHHLFLAVKECLSNIVRHAHATEVGFRVATGPGGLEIAIEDNGRGMPAEAKAGGDGLRNIRQRMAEIGGGFRLEVPAGGGTRILLHYP